MHGECQKPGISTRRGYCFMHYYRFCNGIDMDAPPWLRHEPGQLCDVEDCGLIATNDGSCGHHYNVRIYQTSRRAKHILRRYKLTLEEYGAKLEAQGGCCAICSKPPAVEKALAVDHDHACCNSDESCGECVRGILCDPCNMGIATLERFEWRVKADEYLSYWSKEPEYAT